MAKTRNAANLLRGKKPKSLWGGATKTARIRYKQQLGQRRKPKSPVQVHKELVGIRTSSRTMDEIHNRTRRYTINLFCSGRTKIFFNRFFFGKNSTLTFKEWQSELKERVKKFVDEKPVERRKRIFAVLREIVAIKKDIIRADAKVGAFTGNLPKLNSKTIKGIPRRYERVSLQDDIMLSNMDILGNDLQSAMLMLNFLERELKKQGGIG